MTITSVTETMTIGLFEKMTERDRERSNANNISTNISRYVRDCENVEMYKRRNQTMKKRSNNIAKIPNFWLIALKNSSEVGPIFKVDEQFYDNNVDIKDSQDTKRALKAVEDVQSKLKCKTGCKLQDILISYTY